MNYSMNGTEQENARMSNNKYQREIKPGVFVDVYDVLKAWAVRNPALQHLIKKALAVGQRGHKDVAEDLQDIVDSAVRAQELDGPVIDDSIPLAAVCDHEWMPPFSTGTPLAGRVVCRKCAEKHGAILNEPRN